MSDQIVFMKVSTSIDSVARQYECNAPRGHKMEKYGANHLSSYKALALAYECINPGGLASKEGELHRINVATWKELYPYAHAGAFPSRIAVPCIMNQQPQTLIFHAVEGGNPHVEVSLQGSDGRSVRLENVKNFTQLYWKLQNELGFDAPPDDIDSDGNTSPYLLTLTDSYMINEAGSDAELSEAPKESVASDSFKPYDLYRSNSNFPEFVYLG